MCPTSIYTLKLCPFLPPHLKKKSKVLSEFPPPSISDPLQKHLMDVLKKWKKLAVAPKDNSKKSMKFLKKTSAQSNDVPKGFLAVCVGEEMKRFVIPTDYLHHEAFGVLLREAEEEYGFQQEGVLRIPCEVAAFERILEMVQQQKTEGFCYGDSEVEIVLANYHLPQKMMCR